MVETFYTHYMCTAVLYCSTLNCFESRKDHIMLLCIGKRWSQVIKMRTDEEALHPNGKKMNAGQAWDQGIT